MRFARVPEMLTASAILIVLAVMIVPVPTAFIDLLLVTNIALALILLLVTLYVKQPLQFSSFPTLLLFTTLLRLSLNVASTRAILLNGYGGEVISAFGSFVVGGTRPSDSSHSSFWPSSSSSSSRRVRAGSRKSRPDSRWTRCPGVRWPSTRI